MDEDKINISVRKLLKVVGITVQREIAKAGREVSNAGHLQGNENLTAKMTFEIQVPGVTHVVEGDIELGCLSAEASITSRSAPTPCTSFKSRTLARPRSASDKIAGQD